LNFHSGLNHSRQLAQNAARQAYHEPGPDRLPVRARLHKRRKPDAENDAKDTLDTCAHALTGNGGVIRKVACSIGHTSHRRRRHILLNYICFDSRDLERPWGRSPPEGRQRPYLGFLRYLDRLVGEGKAAHARLDAQDVVVDGEHLLQGEVRLGSGAARLQVHGHLGVVNAREVASAGRLVLLRLQGEGVGVDARVRGAGVVQQGHVLVEVLAQLLLEAVLAVEHQLELVQRAHLLGGVGAVALLHPVAVGNAGDVGQQVRAANLVGQHSRAAESSGDGGHLDGRRVGGEVPQGVGVGRARGVRVGVAPDQLLHRVVEGQADQGGTRLGRAGDGVTAGVLHLLNQVLVALLGEAAALLGVQVHVVGPHLNGVGAEVVLVVGGQVEVQAHLVVLQGNQRQVQARVAVEEEQQRQVHLGTGGGRRGQGGRGQLAVVDLVALTQEALGVQAEPGLVVLVNALATDGQLNGSDGTLSHPAAINLGVGGRAVSQSDGGRGQGNVHVADQVAVAGDGHGHTAAVGGRAVHRLLDHLHGEVGVTLVHRLEEGHLGLTRQINILSTVSHELHKSTCHDCLVLVAEKKIYALNTHWNFLN